jgi:hypothetical protein
MNRSEFLHTLLGAAGAAAASSLLPAAPAAAEEAPPCADALKQAEGERQFVANWLDDLLEAVDEQLTPAARVKLVEHCGKKCFLRHSFKQDLAKRGAGDVDRLVAAYQESFEAWRDGDRVHIRYGKVSKGCYCPAARLRPVHPNDAHCECTRATHQAVFEAALGRVFPTAIVETVRRGGVTCHFVVNVAG